MIKNNKFVPALNIFLILLFSACEKTEKVDNFPKHQSKLVANCFFRPDTSFLFKLFRSLSPIDNAPFKELTSNKAYIKVYENNVLFDSLTYHPTLTTSFSSGDPNKRPKVGNTYRFECHYPGFDVVSAEDYLPDGVSIQKIKGYYTILNSYESNDTMINGNFFTNMNIDLGTSSQYLIIKIGTLSKSYTGPYYPGSYDSYIYDISDLNTSNEAEYISNSLYVTNPGGVKTLNLKWNTDYGFIFKNKASYKYDINVHSCSKAAFEYLKRQALQQENNDDPFSQPTPISNNIVNGYGVFGGINSTADSTSF